MERVSDEWLNLAVIGAREEQLATAQSRLYEEQARVYAALKELQERRRAEKEHKNIEANLESVKPIPVKRCKIDEVEQDVKEWTIKRWFAKINEELDEMKEAVYGSIRRDAGYKKDLKYMYNAEVERITEEAIDTITVIISFLEAMGIDEEQRNEAQRFVNEKNRKRGRL